MLRQGLVCLLRNGQFAANTLGQPVMRNSSGGCKLFHANAGALFGVTGKDVKSKDFVVKASRDGKDASLNSAAIDLTGLTDSGFTIPTLETHEMTVDGVRYDELPIVHVFATLNNTILTVTDYTGKNIVVIHSCGSEGFKNVKKSTTVAAQATGLSTGQMVLKKGIKNVRVALKGIGTGRQAVIKGLQMSGLCIVSLTDKTPIHHDAPRPRKAKRL